MTLLRRPRHFTWAFIGVLASATFVYAGFSTSEFGEGSFDTGSTATIVNNGQSAVYDASSADPVVVANLAASSPQACTETWAVNHCTELGLTGNIAQSNISSLSNYELAAHDLAIDGQFSTTNYPGFAGLDTDNDGYVSNSEIVTYLSQTSGVTFDGTYAEQAIQIFKQLGDSSVCSGDPDAACIQTAINNTNDFAAELLESATTGGVAADLSDAASELASGDIDVSAGADNERLAAFDRNNDGTLTGAEIVALLASDPTAGASVTQPSGDAGLYARAYLEELAQCSTIDSACIQTAVTAGNDWAVHPPQVTAPSTLAIDSTSTANASATDALTVYDGTCASGASCVAAPSNVEYSVRTRYTRSNFYDTNGDGSVTSADSDVSFTWDASAACVSSDASVSCDPTSNPFSVNSAGRITVNAISGGVDFLPAGVYTLNVTATDDNDDSYNSSITTSDLTLTVSNEDGCIIATDVASNEFNTSGTISGAAVTISNRTDNDVLFVKGATKSNPTLDGTVTYTNIKKASDPSQTWSGVSATYDPNGGMMRFTGSQTKENWVKIFDLVGYIFDSSGSPGSKSLIFSLSNKVPYLHTDGTYHFYDYIPADEIDFENALTAARSASNTLMGLTGYVATITTAAEQNYVNPRVRGNGWLAACDDLGRESSVCNNVEGDSSATEAEGYWYWVDGPEKGSYMGRRTGYPNTPPNNNDVPGSSATWNTVNADYPFANWSSGEPNNYNVCDDDREDVLHVWANTTWNDFCHTWDNIDGYLIEWGGPASTTWGQVNGSAIRFTVEKTYDPSQATYCVHQ